MTLACSAIPHQCHKEVIGFVRSGGEKPKLALSDRKKCKITSFSIIVSAIK
jgi:hypothetical protein